MEKRRGLTLVFVAIVLLAAFWTNSFLLPAWVSSSSSTFLRRFGDLYQFPISPILSLGLIVAASLLCVTSFRSRVPWGARGIVVIVLIFMLFISFKSFMSGRGTSQAMLDRFGASVSSSTNFHNIVTWARDLLADTNNPAGGFRTSISSDKLPKELFGLYDGPNAEGTTPQAAIFRDQTNAECVAINYHPGSVFRFAILIGNESLTIQPNSVKKWKKLDDGVFVVLDWP